jgi:hypothetical protein
VLDGVGEPTGTLGDGAAIEDAVPDDTVPDDAVLDDAVAAAGSVDESAVAVASVGGAARAA